MIAPSKLGSFVHREGTSDAELLRRLREVELVRADVQDADLLAVFKKARDEHAALPKGARDYNSPNERVRVFLGLYLSEKGRQWAVPLKSLDLPDE